MELPMFYNEVEEWNRALLLYDAALKEINTKLEILNNEFKMAHQYNPIEHITSRVKSLQSIAKKIRRKGMELTVENIVKYVNDVAGIRIICSFASDIYRIADLLTQQNDIRVLKVKDYIVSPKPNGYMSYHMIVTVPIFLANDVVETKVEIQIRTIAMDFWASLEHKIYYKFEGNAPAHIREDLKECAQIVSYLDKKMLMINDEVRALEERDYEAEEYQRKQKTAYFESVKDYYGKLSEDDGTETEVIIEHEELSEEIETFSREGMTSSVIELPDRRKEAASKGLSDEFHMSGKFSMPEDTRMSGDRKTSEEFSTSRSIPMRENVKISENRKLSEELPASESIPMPENNGTSENRKVAEELPAAESISMPEDIGTPEDMGIEKWGSLAVFLENRRKKARYNKCEMSPASAGSE